MNGDNKKLIPITAKNDPNIPHWEVLARQWIATGRRPEEANVGSTSWRITGALAAGRLDADEVREEGLEWCWKRLNKRQRDLIQRVNPTGHEEWTKAFGAEVYYR
jgi:hypothetical protein